MCDLEPRVNLAPLGRGVIGGHGARGSPPLAPGESAGPDVAAAAPICRGAGWPLDLSGTARRAVPTGPTAATANVASNLAVRAAAHPRVRSSSSASTSPPDAPRASPLPYSLPNVQTR
eukprot:4849513-Pyramimonas_sp.AAC.1